MKAKVFSVFCSLGKTTVGNKYENVCDLASSKYRHDYSKVKNEDLEKEKYKEQIPNKEWPNNYIDALKKAISEYDIVLVPSNIDIRNLLVANKIEFTLVLPKQTEEYRKIILNRLKERGNSEKLIACVMNWFKFWSRNPSDYKYPIEILNEDEFLEDLLIKKGLV